jgi:hypothetical protein
MSRFAATLLAVLALTGCGSSDDTSNTPAAAKGSASLRFDVEPFVRSSSRLKDPLKGTVYGNIYLAEDVGLGGPIEGAKAFANVVLPIDVVAAGPSTATLPVKDLPEGRYIFLGFFDVDGNGDSSRSPDEGDPVTMPTEDNKFDVAPGKETAATVKFNLVYGG